MCPCCYQQGGSLLHCLSTLTSGKPKAVYFCCTGLGVTSTGRYPASCPVKPGLSSPGSLRCRPRLFILLTSKNSNTDFLICQRSFSTPTLLCVETTAAHEFSADGIIGNRFTAHAQEIIQEFKQALGLIIFRHILSDAKQ